MTPIRTVLRHSRVAVAVLVAVAALSTSVGAQAPTAEELYQEAVVRYRLAKFKDAVRLLRRASKGTKDPKLLGRIYLHLGIANVVLNNKQEAEKAFRLGLTYDPELSLDPNRFKDPMVDLFGKVRRSLRGELSVAADRDGALVIVDGKKVGKVPYQAFLSIGQHQVEVRTGDGRYGAVKQVVIATDQKVRMTVTLEKLVAKLTVRSTPAGAQVFLDGTSVGKTPLEKAVVGAGAHKLTVRLDGYREVSRKLRVRRDQEEMVELRLQQVPTAKESKPAGAPSGRSRLKRPWAWVTAGVGVACIGVGAGLLATRRVDEVVQEDDGKIRKVTDSAAPGGVLIGVGAAALAVSVYLFARSEKPVQVALDVTGDRVVAAVAGRF